MARADGATSDEEGPEDEEKRGGHRMEGEGAAGFEEEWAAAVAPLPRLGPAPPGGGYTPVAFPTVNRFCMALLYGRAGCLTSQNGGFRPGSSATALKNLAMWINSEVGQRFRFHGRRPSNPYLSRCVAVGGTGCDAECRWTSSTSWTSSTLQGCSRTRRSPSSTRGGLWCVVGRGHVSLLTNLDAGHSNISEE